MNSAASIECRVIAEGWRLIDGPEYLCPFCGGGEADTKLRRTIEAHGISILQPPPRVMATGGPMSRSLDRLKAAGDASTGFDRVGAFGILYVAI